MPSQYHEWENLTEEERDLVNSYSDWNFSIVDVVRRLDAELSEANAKRKANHTLAMVFRGRYHVCQDALNEIYRLLHKPYDSVLADDIFAIADKALTIHEQNKEF